MGWTIIAIISTNILLNLSFDVINFIFEQKKRINLWLTDEQIFEKINKIMKRRIKIIEMHPGEFTNLEKEQQMDGDIKFFNSWIFERAWMEENNI